MNYFKIEIVGETLLSDEHIGEYIDVIHDYVEYVMGGECSMVYTPTNEQGDVLKSE